MFARYSDYMGCYMVSMTSNEDDSVLPLELIVDNFLEAYRGGKNPDIEAYCKQHQEIAAELRVALSTAFLLENARPEPDPLVSLSSPNEKYELVGECLGDFRLIREAGRGGMGVVYEAIQKSLGRRVALKILPRQFTQSPSQLERFQREAKAVASLHHTNIVPVFAVGEDQGVHYFVMPFIDGTGLEKILKELRIQAQGRAAKSTLPLHEGVFAGTYPTTVLYPSDNLAVRGDNAKLKLETDSTSDEGELVICNGELPALSNEGRRYWIRVARIGLQVADALQYAFQQGVLHRDIKPSNLLLDSAGLVWVTDFGLAKISDCDDLTRTGELLGTLRYLAPERLDGVHDVRGDIYSLGLTLYELITLQGAFTATDNSALTKQIVSHVPARPRSIDPRIPLDLETIVQKAIAKDASDRYQTPGAMAADLRLFIDDQPISSRRSNRIEHIWRWCRRNPTTSGLLTCVVLLMLTTMALLLATNSRIRRETDEKSIALEEKNSALVEKFAALTAKNTALDERESAYRQSLVSEQLARRRFYAAQINLAGQAYQNGDVTRAEDLLTSVVPVGDEPDFRGFEWNYLQSALHHGLRHTFSHPGNEISCMSFSPEGSRLLVAGGKDYGGLFCLHDLISGRVIFGPKLLGCNINGCAYAPDGSAIALGHGDGVLQVFSASTFEQLHQLSTDVTIKALAWSPDSKLLVAGFEDGSLVVCKTPAFKSLKISKAHQGPILRLFFSRDSSQLFTSADWGGEGKLSRQWDATQWPPVVVRDFANQSLGDIAADGRTLAGMEWGVLHLVDVGDGRRMQERPVSTGPLVALRYVPNSNFLLVASRTDRAVQRLDRTSLELLGKNSQSHTVSALAVDPHGKYWAAGDAAGDVRVWELEIRDFQRGISDAEVKSAFFLRGANEVVLGGTGPSRCWSLSDDSVAPFQLSVGLRAMTRDGKTSVCVRGDSTIGNANSVEIWRAGHGVPRVIELDEPIYRNCLALSSSGRWLAIRADEQPIKLYDLSQSPPKLMHSLVGPCFQLTFSPDEKQLVGGEQHGRVIEFDVTSGARLPNYGEFDSWWAWGMSVAYSPDGTFVASGNEAGLVRVWETESRKLVASLAGQAGEIRAVAFFPDNRRLAVGGTGDVRIWDFPSGQELLGLPIDGGLVQSLAVNDAGDTLVAVMPQGGVRAWVGATEIRE